MVIFKNEFIMVLTAMVKKILNQSKILYDPPPRVTEIKAKINKWDLIKLKSFLPSETLGRPLHSKGNYKQIEKTKSMEWEKMLQTMQLTEA